MSAIFSFLFPIAHAVTISMAIPGSNPNSSSTSPGAFIGNLYQFALIIGGVLAFGIIVFGGVKYMASAGNPSGQGDAKEWIQAALLGLLLLIGAYFILDIVNPQLLNLGLPTLTPASITPTATGCNISCPSGYVPSAVGGAGTSQPTTSCACENANGTQGCGGNVAGDPNSCGAGNVCAKTITNGQTTYSCQPSSQFDCGTPPNHFGSCANPTQYTCVNYNGSTDPKTVIYACERI